MNDDSTRRQDPSARVSIESGAKPTRHPLGSFLAGGIISALHIRDMHRLVNHLPASSACHISQFCIFYKTSHLSYYLLRTCRPSRNNNNNLRVRKNLRI